MLLVPAMAMVWPLPSMPPFQRGAVVDGGEVVGADVFDEVGDCAVAGRT